MCDVIVLSFVVLLQYMYHFAVFVLRDIQTLIIHLEMLICLKLLYGKRYMYFTNFSSLYT